MCLHWLSGSSYPPDTSEAKFEKKWVFRNRVVLLLLVMGERGIGLF